MATNVMYSCDMCRRMLSSERMQGLVRQGSGSDWRGWNAAWHSDEAAWHICWVCLKSLGDIYIGLTFKGPEGEQAVAELEESKKDQEGV